MAPVSRAKAKAELAENGPKTRSKRRELSSSPRDFEGKRIMERRNSLDSFDGSCDEQKRIKKKAKKKKTTDNDDDETITDDEYSDDTDEDHQYIIHGENLKKKYKVRYYDEFGIEDEIKEMKDPSFKKENYKVVRAEYVKAKPRTRNVNTCVVCDEMGEDLVTCVRCPASFHTSCIESAMPCKKRPYESWICKRCKYEQNVLKKPKRVAKILPFDEDERYISTVEETLKKIPEEEMTLAKAFDVIAGLANPKSFVMPKDVLDHLVDMPYMEHIPRKLACSKTAVCYSCKAHPSQESPAIECDYCPAKFHLHCLDPPMTEVFNEFWMCPLHGEIGIDRFVLNTTGISKRMHYWNKCRTKINTKKTWREFVRKVKTEPLRTVAEPADEGDVPPILDWKFVKHRRPVIKEPEKVTTSDSESSEEDKEMDETKFLALKPKEAPIYESIESDNEKGTVSTLPFYERFKAKKYVARNGFYPPELMNAKETYFGMDGLERDCKMFQPVSVEDLYYPEDGNQTTLAEEAAREIMQKYPFLLKPANFEESMDIEMQEPSTLIQNEIQKVVETEEQQPMVGIEIQEPIKDQMIFEDVPKMELLRVAELFDGQFCFPIKVFRETRYFVKYYTDGNEIIGLYKKVPSPLDLKLMDQDSFIIAETAPEMFAKRAPLYGERKEENNSSKVVHNTSGIESEYDSDDGYNFYSSGTMTENINKRKKMKKEHKRMIAELDCKKKKTKAQKKKNIEEKSRDFSKMKKLKTEEENVKERSEPKKDTVQDLKKKVEDLKMNQLKIVHKEKSHLDLTFEKPKNISKSIDPTNIVVEKAVEENESDTEVVIIETPEYRRALRKAKQEAAKAKKEEEEKLKTQAAERGENLPTSEPCRRGGWRRRGKSRKSSVKGSDISKIYESLNTNPDMETIMPRLTAEETVIPRLKPVEKMEEDEALMPQLEAVKKMDGIESANALLCPTKQCHDQKIVITEKEDPKNCANEPEKLQSKKLKIKGKMKKRAALLREAKKWYESYKQKRKGSKISATSAPRLMSVGKKTKKLFMDQSDAYLLKPRTPLYEDDPELPPLINPPGSKNQEKKQKTPPRPKIIQPQPEAFEEPSLDFAKLLEVECRKVGHFLYLIVPQPDGTFMIISRLRFNDQVLAYFSNHLEQQKLAAAEYCSFLISGEDRVIDYTAIISAVQNYEKQQNNVSLRWKLNYGIIEASDAEVKKNIDDTESGEYILDKRFVIPSLPIIGSLFIISPYHSFATIPIFYPSCNIGKSDDDTIDLSIIAPKCNVIRKKHCSIVYDKSSCCVYIKPLGYTVINDNLYGGVSTSATFENICPCVKYYQKARFFGNRMQRINIENDTVIRIGCIKFKVMLMPIEDIWNQIPDTNLRITDTLLPISMMPSMNEAPDPFDDELSASSLSNTDSESENFTQTDLPNLHVIL